MSVVVLGISGFYHDAAAAIVRDGEIVAAAQEERFSRKKHDPRFPRHAINYCLEEAFVEPERARRRGLLRQPAPDASIAWSRASWRSRRGARAVDQGGGVVPRRQARSSTRYVRDSAEVGRAGAVHRAPPVARGIGLLPVAVRGGGDPHASTASASGPPRASARRRRRDRARSRRSTIRTRSGCSTARSPYFCGFKVNSGEYKLMGLAPYGRPRYADRIREHLIDVKPDGSFRLEHATTSATSTRLR